MAYECFRCQSRAMGSSSTRSTASAVAKAPATSSRTIALRIFMWGNVCRTVLPKVNHVMHFACQGRWYDGNQRRSRGKPPSTVYLRCVVVWGLFPKAAYCKRVVAPKFLPSSRFVDGESATCGRQRAAFPQVESRRATLLARFGSSSLAWRFIDPPTSGHGSPSVARLVTGGRCGSPGDRRMGESRLR